VKWAWQLKGQPFVHHIQSREERTCAALSVLQSIGVAVQIPVELGVVVKAPLPEVVVYAPLREQACTALRGHALLADARPVPQLLQYLRAPPGSMEEHISLAVLGRALGKYTGLTLRVLSLGFDSPISYKEYAMWGQEGSATPKSPVLLYTYVAEEGLSPAQVRKILDYVGLTPAGRTCYADSAGEVFAMFKVTPAQLAAMT
jgi:hypothetical protein